MIRYRRLYESFDKSAVTAAQLVRMLENSKEGKELKERARLLDFREIELLAKQALNAVYTGCEEAGEIAVPDAKWTIQKDIHGRRGVECWIGFRVVDFDKNPIRSYPREAMENIERNLEEIGDEGHISSSDCFWELSFSDGRKCELVIWLGIQE